MAFLKAPKVRGVALPHRKHTENSETREIPAPAKVMVPTTMHIGTPAMAIVQKGDYVCVGTKISEGLGFITSCSHSPISGTVQGTQHFVMPDGSRNAAVIIENDGEYNHDPDIAPPTVTDRAVILAGIKRALTMRDRYTILFYLRDKGKLEEYAEKATDKLLELIK